MIAPSGKFWIARARAAAVMPAVPLTQPAYTTPTAMFSGILCRVTVSTSMVVRFRLAWGPSAVLSRYI